MTYETEMSVRWVWLCAGVGCAGLVGRKVGRMRRVNEFIYTNVHENEPYVALAVLYRV